MPTCKLFVGNFAPELAIKVGQRLEADLVSAKVDTFQNGELNVCSAQILSRQAVFVWQSVTEDVHRDIFELLLMLNVARSSGASKIIVVIPFFPYARQNHPHQDGCMPTQLILKLLKTAGAYRVVTVDMHHPENITNEPLPFCNVNLEPFWLNQLRTMNLTNACIWGADRSMQQRASSLAKALCLSSGYSNKLHDGAHRVIVKNMYGDVVGKTVYVIDDRIDTGRTLCAVAEALAALGARRIIGVVSHAFLQASTLERLKASPISRLIRTDTTPIAFQNSDFVQTLSINEVLADGLRSVLL